MMEKSFAPMYLLQVDAFSNACIWPWPFHKASESEPRAAENNSWEGWIIGVVGEGSDSQVWVSCVNLQLVDVTKKTKSDFQWLFTILKCWFIDSSILVCQPQWVQTFKVLQMQQMCWQKIIEKYCWIYLQGKWKLGKVPDFNRKYSKKHRSICKLQAQISYELPYICPKSNTHSWCFDIWDWIWWYQYQKKNVSEWNNALYGQKSQKFDVALMNAQEQFNVPKRILLTMASTRFEYLIHSFNSLLKNKYTINYLYGGIPSIPQYIRSRKPS